MIEITGSIFLQPYDGLRSEALSWYQNPDLQRLVNGTSEPYQEEQVLKMYNYQSAHGELYYILWRETDETMVTIGDVWLAPADFAILLDPAYQQRGIASAIVKYFLQQTKALGWKQFTVGEVYPENSGSNALFTRIGFIPTIIDGKTGYLFPLQSTCD